MSTERPLKHWKVEFGSYAYVYQLWETDRGYRFECIHEPSFYTVFSTFGESIGVALREGFSEMLKRGRA